MDSSLVSESDDDSIEIVSVCVQPEGKAAESSKNVSELEFIVSELTNGGGRMDVESIKNALAKYEVEATENLILDMLDLVTQGDMSVEERVAGLCQRAGVIVRK